MLLQKILQYIYICRVLRNLLFFVVVPNPLNCNPSLAYIFNAKNLKIPQGNASEQSLLVLLAYCVFSLEETNIFSLLN